MQVTNHQMHAMLECYSKKLIHTHKNGKPPDTQREKPSMETLLSRDSTREATMAKISQQVLDKVTDVVALSISQPKTHAGSPGETDDSAVGLEQTENEFTFNVIDPLNRKRTDRLAIGDSATLIRRMERMAQKAAMQKTATLA